MLTDAVNANKVFHSIDVISAELLHLINSEDEQTINLVPFEGSWTAAQLMVHVEKSTKSIAQALKLESKKIDRDPAQKIQEFRDMFLDYKKKFNSPAFILPTEDFYKKDMLVDDYEKTFIQLKKNASETDLSQAIVHPAFGEVTKFELLYFVSVHTERHVHQLNKIINHLK